MDKFNYYRNYKIKTLFCFPFAGGGFLSYRGLGTSIDSITVSTFELPGRGRRFGEPLLEDINLMVEDLFRQIQHQVQSPYAFYGHSMGAILAYLLAKRLICQDLPPPVFLFVSGNKGPVAVSTEQRHLLPKHEFYEMLKELGGCPVEILLDPELMDLYEPVLRADFSAIAGYRHVETSPFHIPITVLIGINDNISEEDALQWQRETTQQVRLVKFPGDHFFIFHLWHEIRQLFSEYLALDSQVF